MNGPADTAGSRGRRRLAIVAGRGEYPLRVAEAAQAQGAEVYVAALAGAADPSDYGAYDVGEYRLGQLGRFLDEIKRRRIGEIVMIGGLPRPSFGALAPELSTLKYLPHFARAFQGGDDHLLRGVVGGFFEGQGCACSGRPTWPPTSSRRPARSAATSRRRRRAAIATGFELLAALSPFDIGQAAVVADHRIVAVEAAEGTDAMIERVGMLVEAGRLKLGKGDGVLVKAPKLGQDLRVDMPAIGPDTLTRAAAAGLAGIGVKAGSVLVGDRARLATLADASGLFVEGVA